MVTVQAHALVYCCSSRARILAWISGGSAASPAQSFGPSRRAWRPAPGTATHPTRRIIYAGLTGAKQIGVFTYDASGALTFVRAVADQGAGPCWVTVSADGQRLYVANTGTDSIGVFSLADPLNPVQIQELKLAGPLVPPGAPASPIQTNVFQIALDPTGRSLYAVTHSVSPTHTFPKGNALHVFSVAEDGTLSETADSPVFFSESDVPPTAHPQGLAIVTREKGEDHDR